MEYTILIAEDSEISLALIKQVFEAEQDNYSIIIAKNGEIACRKALQKLPDLIIMDLGMPLMNGIDAIKHLKKTDETKDIPIIVLTVSNNLQEAFEAGATDFVQKPFNQIELIARAKSAIGLVKSLKEIKKQKKEILDNISYAKCIQKAVFPPDEFINEILPQHFILFKPKTIVGGDFYWMAQKNGKTFLAAADCTGHGVSGALLNMIGIVFLNEIISNNIIYNANEILSYLRKDIIKALRQTGKKYETHDGIDIALCILDSGKKTLQYSGANNPLYFIRNDELAEIKADRMPVGIHVRMNQKFTNHVIQLEKGDSIYLFSDGYPDQFGGPEGVKFRYKKFKQLLLSIHDKPMKKQKAILDKTMQEWQGNFEQIDDMLILGFRI